VTRASAVCGTGIICITFPFSVSTETANRSFQKSFGFREKVGGLR
jgi:hypothetical protein